MAYRQQRSNRRSNFNSSPMMNNYSTMPIPGQQQMLRKDEPMKQQFVQQAPPQNAQNQNVQNVQNMQRPPASQTPGPIEQSAQNNVPAKNNVAAKNNVQAMLPPSPAPAVTSSAPSPAPALASAKNDVQAMLPPSPAPFVTSSVPSPATALASTPVAPTTEQRTGEDTEMQDNDGNDDQRLSRGEEELKKIRRRYLDGIRKKPSIRAKEKRIRQNRRLGKVLIPKNALMALHEVKGISISDFVLNARPGGGFTAEVTVNNIQFDGCGASKTAAKNMACEKALRDLIISKMLSKSKKVDLKPESNVLVPPPEVRKPETGEDVEMKSVEEPNEEEELPMINLASFALYKLFSEWENEGFEIPEFRPTTTHGTTNGGQAVPVEKPKKPPVIRNELPPNWETMHPAMLLCMMRPGVTYVDGGVTGTPPNTVQTVGLTVDEERFIGQGRSKKAARKNVATKVCNKLFGTNFPVDG